MKKKLVIRHPKDWPGVYFSKRNNNFDSNWKILNKKYNIHAVIKLSSSDYRLIKERAKRLTHFNIQYADHRPGRNYIIVKMDKLGFFDGKLYKPAIINSKNFILARCISIKNYIKYNKLDRRIFKNSLSNIKNVGDLKRVM